MSRDLSVLVPQLRDAVPKILSAMTAAGFPMLVVYTERTLAEQIALYAEGRTAPGFIVTNADGVKKRSNHQRHTDGFVHACDCAFIIDGNPSWDLRLPWKTYGALAVTLGLTWGGSWKSLIDLPHIEVM